MADLNQRVKLSITTDEWLELLTEFWGEGNLPYYCSTHEIPCGREHEHGCRIVVS